MRVISTSLWSQLAMLTSMEHVVILDVKGDWVQMLAKNPDNPKNGFADRGVDVQCFTFGTIHGWNATLDPFTKLSCAADANAKPYNKMTIDEKNELEGRCFTRLTLLHLVPSPHDYTCVAPILLTVCVFS